MIGIRGGYPARRGTGKRLLNVTDRNRLQEARPMTDDTRTGGEGTGAFDGGEGDVIMESGGDDTLTGGSGAGLPSTRARPPGP